jgi:hypothetical protein
MKKFNSTKAFFQLIVRMFIFFVLMGIGDIILVLTSSK